MKHVFRLLLVLMATAGCFEQSDYDNYVSRFTPHVTKQVGFTVRIPVDNQILKVPITLHGYDITRLEDVRHVVLASQRLLAPMSRSKRRNCAKSLGRVDIYHVPCAALNWDELLEELNENYVRQQTNVVLGLTGSTTNRAGRSDFVVGYCFDPLVRRSKKISYEDDPHFREVSLAHEIAHVWFEACEPFDAWFYSARYEEKAWAFHEQYEATARALHVEY